MELIKTLRTIIMNALIVSSIAYAITKKMKQSLIIGLSASIFCKCLSGKNMLEGFEEDIATEIKKSGFLSEEEKKSKQVVKEAQISLEKAINAFNDMKKSEESKFMKNPKTLIREQNLRKKTKDATNVLNKVLDKEEDNMNKIKNLQTVADAPQIEKKSIVTTQKRSRLSMQEQKIVDKVQEEDLRKELKAEDKLGRTNPEYGYSFVPPSEWSKQAPDRRLCVPEKKGGCGVCPTQGINLGNALGGNFLELENPEQLPPMPKKNY